MILLRLISWQYFKKHVLRSLLTTVGIILGVAVFVGMHTANQSVLFAFQKTVDRIAGATQLQVSAGEAGFDETVLERVQAVPGVRVAVPVVEAVVSTGLSGQGNLLILGVDMTGDRTLRDYDLESGDESIIDDPLVFLAQPDSIIVTNTFAAENRLASNSKVPLITMEGPRQFTVRGIMTSSGLASAFGGNLAIMDVYAAQKVFGRGRTFDRIDLGVTEGVPVETVQQRLKTALGDAFEVAAPSARGAQFESLARVYAITANITSLFALLIGLFIIYNTFAIAVTQRRSEIGILRALGATRGQIRTLFLGESAIAGLVGSLIGITLGILIARGIAGSIGNFLGEMYGVAQRAEEVSADPRLLAFALAMGMLTSLIAAYIPARQAAGVDPVRALQKGRYQMLTAGENRTRRRIALALSAAVAVCLVLNHIRPLFYLGYLLTAVVSILLTPSLTHWLAGALRPLLRWLRPVEGALAADSIIQAPRRTSGTVAALMLSLSMVVSLTGLAGASYASIKDWLDTAFNPDMFVSPTASLTQKNFRFPLEMESSLEAVPGVRMVQSVRYPRVMVDGRLTMLVAIKMDKISQTVQLPPVEGDPQEMYRLGREGKGVIISENLSILRGYHKGSTLRLPTPRGTLDMPVLGVIQDFSDQQGSLFIDHSVYLRHWNDNTANVFRLYLQPGASPDVVKREILARFSNERRLFVLLNHELKEYVLRLTDQWFGLTYVQIFVAVLVAILGIVNTLTVSITDRRRELGVLQAVGGLRNQIRRTIWLEAIAIGAIGLVLGLALGAASLYYSLQMSQRELSGLRLSYEYPFMMAAVLLPIVLGAALLSALGPAESAVRGSLVEALEYE